MKQFYSLLRVICLLSFTCVVTLFSCNEETTKPPPTVGDPPFVDDTTISSRNFDYKVYRFGNPESLSDWLNDVSICNQNLAYIVGSIPNQDTLPGEITPAPYNLIKWNGQGWEYFKVKTKGYAGLQGYVELVSVFCVDSNNIWIASNSGGVGHWDGVRWTSEYVTARKGSILKMWGYDKKLYLAGTNGSISYFDGWRWYLLDTKTKANINDVWGYVDSTTGKATVFCCATTLFEKSDRILYKITDGTKVDTIPWEPGVELLSVWCKDERKIFVCGRDAYIRMNGTWYEQCCLVPSSIPRIRGQANNDVFVAASFPEITHYQGRNSPLSWDPHRELSVTFFSSMDYRDNLMIAVGQGQNDGMAVMMKRMK